MAKKDQVKDLPYNAEAERAVLGSALLRSEDLSTVLASLEEGDFFEGRHQLIFRAFNNLYRKGIAVDTLTVTEELINSKVYDEVGGVEYLQECCDAMVAHSALEFYINIVRDNSVLRSMLIAVRDIDERYHTEKIEDIQQFIEESSNSLKDATERRRYSDFQKVGDVAKQVEIFMNTPHEVQEDNVIGLSTGYSALNKLTQGFKRGEMIIVAARPSVGKTALALNIAFRVAARSNKPVALFSLEMTSESLVQRLIGVDSKVNLSKITTGSLTQQELGSVSQTIRKLSKAPLYIDDTPGIKLMDILSKSRKLINEEKDLSLIIVDHLSLVEAGGNNKSSDSRQDEVRRISLALKSLAKELDIPILLVSQLSRNVENRRDNRRPLLSDLRDSGSLEQDADIVMLMYREDYYDNGGAKRTDQAGEKKFKNLSGAEKLDLAQENMKDKIPGGLSFVEINVAKNRNGKTGIANLLFYKDFGRFDEPTPELEAKLKEMAETYGK